MSLIRQRMQRKKSWMDTRKGMPPWRLAGLLIFILALIWYLGWAF
jgi:hypothetical protein